MVVASDNKARKKTQRSGDTMEKTIYRLARIFAVSFFLFIIWIIYLANTGSKSVFFDLIGGMAYGDKLGHFVLFGLLTLGVNIALKFRRITTPLLSIYVGSLLVTAFAVGEEVSQGFISSRTLDLHDLVADIAGIATFTLASHLIFLWLVAKPEGEPSEDSR